MTGRFHSNRADGDDTVTADHRREWRHWIIETVTAGSASVVPVSRLVDTIADREPDEMGRSQIRTALISDVLPAVDSDPGLEYDADRQVVINYGN